MLVRGCGTIKHHHLNGLDGRKYFLTASYNHKSDIALTSLELPDGKETEN